jgi:leucyl-tRNA synthetase
MKNEYNHLKIEKKWQKFWQDKKIYKTSNDIKKKKMYVLDMFPYPSGAGLHVGHPRGYIGSDIYARMKRMQGYNVLHPMGYDAFGLPAEQYAITHGVHPKVAVEKNIATFERQLSIIGLSYDWERRIATTDPKYYKWTQWIFLQIFNSYYDKTKDKARPIKDLINIFDKKGNIGLNAFCDNDTPLFDKNIWKNFSKLEKQKILMKYRLAYEGYADVNWCEELGTVLANDEVLNGPNGELISERGGYKVIRKSMRQWFMRITAYADRLINDLEDLDWNSHIKEIQKNWIGRSEGSEIDFQIIKENKVIDNIKIFTTRADTIFGVSYLVVAPEHKKLNELKDFISNYEEVLTYIKQVATKGEDDRNLAKEKTGIELKGIYAINPANNEKIPIYVADYVLVNYGTGAIMAVPMHDERDREFANKFNLPILDKPLVDSKEITNKLKGKFVLRFKMRDAIFARQRYWGEPIPLYYDNDGIIHQVKESTLPVVLPNVKSYKPLGTGESPLAGVKDWVKKGYETNTMPGWAGSSWYFLRYIDPNNSKAFASNKMLDYYFGKKNGGVDMYVGGAEHATGHLLYARFWHKFLFDIGKVKAKEPFRSLRNQGMIGGADGRKMSKRWGNVINPDDVVKTYGADTLRLYEAFMGPFDQGLPWSTESIIGGRRFVEKIWRLSQIDFSKKTSLEIAKLLHKTIKKVNDDIESFNFNTAVSSMMILANQIEKTKLISKDDFKKFLQISAPFISHLAEEIWFTLGEKKSIHLSTWPKANPKFLIDEEIKIVIQVNGKVRGEIFVANDISEEDLKALILKREDILKYTENKELKKFIYVKGRLASLVV